jgi:PLP dependent protein
VTELVDRLASVDAAIADAIRDAGRDPADVTRIVVTKFHPASLVRELAALGVTDVGENRHQEAAAKQAELTDLDLRWHFIGQLQRNKARAVRAYAASVQSVDRAELADALDRAGADAAAFAPLDVLLELDLSGEPGRGGVAPEDAEALAEHVLTLPTLRLRGVMAVAPLGAEARPAFARVRATGERIRALAPDATALSMGMSGDFRAAILEGATHLRIGTAITGKRSTPA